MVLEVTYYELTDNNDYNKWSRYSSTRDLYLNWCRDYHRYNTCYQVIVSKTFCLVNYFRTYLAAFEFWCVAILDKLTYHKANPLDLTAIS